MASSLVDGVIPSTSSGQALSVAVLQAERRISRYDAVCHGRSPSASSGQALGPLVKTRALRDDALRDSEFKLSHYCWLNSWFGRGLRFGRRLFIMPRTVWRIYETTVSRGCSFRGCVPPGAQMAVLEGDPTASSGDFTVRVKMPDGYKFPPHTHPKRENVTVLSGTLKVGMGDHYDDSKMTSFGTGSFLYVDPTMHHYAGAAGETVIQIHGLSPLQINYINPADDPSTKK